MPTSQQHIDANTPMGANLVPGGATFRVWAPNARSVYVITDRLPAAQLSGWFPEDREALVRQADDTWTGFVPDMTDGSPYRFWMVGTGTTGFKRDPYARELGTDPPFPNCDCLVRSPAFYPWHDGEWRRPEFRDLVIYQLHVGAFYGVDAQGNDVRPHQPAKFLDLLARLDHLRALGVGAVQLLPIQEFPLEFSLGYNGVDYFSPEMAYQVDEAADLGRYLALANQILERHGRPPLELSHLRLGSDQLKCVIDLFHLEGIAVIFDLVYNHAGGGFDDQSLFFLDRQPVDNLNDSLYFTDQGWAGGLIFAYWNASVRQFLIDNARFFLDEYHIDGIRYDEVSVIDSHGGWGFAQDLASTVRYVKPSAIQIAEYWNEPRWQAVVPPSSGMGFDAALGDGLRDHLRAAVGAASVGKGALVNLTAVAGALSNPPGFADAWRTVNCLENHDIVRVGREPRLAALADSSDPQSWYGRSRSRAATGLLLTAPGIPHLFMGQELLEAKNWSDNPSYDANTLIDWNAFAADSDRRDFFQCIGDFVRLRSRLPALRGENLNVFHVHDENRILAFHRWVDGQNVVVVVSFNESVFWEYRLGFPGQGAWSEVFNSDVYDHFPNPWAAGNAGAVFAGDSPMHGLPASASLVIPANGLLVFNYKP